ncbi:MAG: hypothetical protein KGJ62_14070 [Armatimonadetes bacterium]|nr:hypothetical protein [Armatimonadota bacterium]MDE2207014.1 hypothetical protein [Armatimonadota bacterium]
MTATAPNVTGEPLPSAIDPRRTRVGWQGVTLDLPPDWTVSGFSLDKMDGYVRVDSPGNGGMTVQVRWLNATRPRSGSQSLYSLTTQWMRRTPRVVVGAGTTPDLRDNLDRMMKDAEKQAKKARRAFESSAKPEHTEGEDGERQAVNFKWQGDGRAQGKIWYCSQCQRVVIAQVVGLQKDAAAISTIGALLFQSIRCHSRTDCDLWAIFGLELEVPTDFLLKAHSLTSGHMHLEFRRRAERLLVDRWGLANVTLKRFSLADWVANNAVARVSRLAAQPELERAPHGAVIRSGGSPLMLRLRMLPEIITAPRTFPALLDVAAWECKEANRIMLLQALRNRRSAGLIPAVLQSCRCH